MTFGLTLRAGPSFSAPLERDRVRFERQVLASACRHQGRGVVDEAAAFEHGGPVPGQLIPLYGVVARNP